MLQLVVNYIVVYDFCGFVADIIHSSDPLHLVIRFEFFCHALTLCQLFYKPKKHKESGVVQSYIVGGLSIALPPVLGTSAPFLAPVIAIVLLTIGKIGLNAWLATRKEKREKEKSTEE